MQRRTDRMIRMVSPVRVSRVVFCAVISCFCVSTALAGSVRVWSSAVVVDDTIHLGDVAELRLFDVSMDERLRGMKVADAPPPGGSRFIHMDMIRAVVEGAGANMAEVNIRGASQCAVTRPAVAQQHVATAERPSVGRVSKSGQDAESTKDSPASTESTLRDAVQRYFDSELARYNGVSDLVFDRTSADALDLVGDKYEFKVRRRTFQPLGLVQVIVDVVDKGVTLQTIPLVVQVSLKRQIIVARRPINQGATIRSVDLEPATLTFTRLSNLGITDASEVIGQRAMRYIPAGSPVEESAIESVPLVQRGQLVTLRSVVGAVRVVTSVKALQSGLLGETITVRTTDKRRAEFDAVVVGPAIVQLGAAAKDRLSVARKGGDS